ncbi:MerC domain-containing protein [Frateuria defendens]|uniref:MerC domain-containing protein n=1 Tax=Frateuria defendens TaxID=2219559 RepID=UPI00066FC2A2|nr:MerC domain-containing protein [Frateuria defendens]
MNPGQDQPTNWRQLADRIGAGASFLCAIHCAALPFVLAALPVLGLEFLADHRFEHGFVLFASALALASLLSAYRHHRRALPLMLALPGLLLLLLGVTVAERYPIALHSTLVTTGGLLVAVAHFVNLRLHRLVHQHGCAVPAAEQ